MTKQKSMGDILKAAAVENQLQSVSSKESRKSRKNEEMSALDASAVGVKHDGREQDGIKSTVSGMSVVSLRNDDEVKAVSGLLTDKYSLSTSVGKGAFGEVFIATNKATGETFAAKSMPMDDSDNYENEFDIAKKLKHPNIVKLHDMYLHEEVCYLVMDLCPGGDLFDLIGSHRRIEAGVGAIYEGPSEMTLARFMWQMLQSIRYLHHHGIVHRDIKLLNFLLDSTTEETANVKLIDFGMSTNFVKGTLLTEAWGTAEYIAPEMLTKQGYDEKCDVWSVGICGFVMFDGNTPIPVSEKDESDLEKIKSIIDAAEISYKGMSGNYPKAVPELLQLLLQKDPSKRISAKDVLATNVWLRQKGRGRQDGCCTIS